LLTNVLFIEKQRKRAQMSGDKKHTWKNLALADFARIFNTSTKELPTECKLIINSHDFRYRYLEGKERDAAILQAIQPIVSGSLSKVGKERQPIWHTGWKENLQAFEKNKFDLNSLYPKYFHSGRAFRIEGQYAVAKTEPFEINFGKVFKTWLFKKYFSKVESIYEFGCGSGINIAILAQLFPDKPIHGLDWVSPSKKIVDHFSKHFDWKTEGHIFNMFKPNKKFKLDPNSGVLLFSVLEQMGNNYHDFLSYLISQKPKIVVHVDSMEELYNPKNLLDYIAVSYGKNRNYLSEYLTNLKELARRKRVQILQTTYVNFGNLFLDGYSFDIWRSKD